MSFDFLSESFEVGELLSPLGVKRAQGRAGCYPLCIVASIANLRQIEQAYDTTFANVVRHLVFERVRILCEENSGTIAVTGDRMLLIFDALLSEPATEVACTPTAASLIDRVLTILDDRPVASESAIAFPVITARVAQMDDAPFDISAIAVPQIQSPQPGKAWRDQFILDMEVATRIFDAMRNGRLAFIFEPIREASGHGVTAYEEALLCEIPAGTSDRVRIGRQLASLEHIGLVRRLDRWVVDAVLDSLRDDPGARLGCNISAQSATVDAWWTATLLTLRQEPEIARRLTIEITETVPLTNYDEAYEFVRVFQHVGCRIALDDIGGGYSSFKHLLILGADIAKIDGSLVRHARIDVSAHVRLTRLVALVASCVSTVVIEGIETEEDAHIARSTGVHCLQGYLFSKPYS